MEAVKTISGSRAKSGNIVKDGLGNDIMKGIGMGIGAMAAGGLGIWAISCLVAGVIKAGGPAVLIEQWFKAVTGM